MEIPTVSYVVPKEEIYTRILKFKRKLNELGIPFALITQNVDLYYFTGTMQKGMLLIHTEGEDLFFVEKSTERAIRETPLHVLPLLKKDTEREIAKRIKGSLCGMELDVLPYNTCKKWIEALGLNPVDVSPIIKSLRSVKSEYEIRQIKMSGILIDEVLKKAKKVIKEGKTELQIAAELEAWGRKKGHQGYLRMRGYNQEMDNICVTSGSLSTFPSSFTDAPIQGYGLTPAFPHGPSLQRVRKNTPILLDYGGGYNGYTTDETRTYLIGRLPKAFEKPYELALDIIDYVRKTVKEGVTTRDIYTEVLKMVKKAKMNEYFMGYKEGKVSFLGHGIGLEINELPLISERHPMTLTEGMVFALEPKFVIPGIGAIGVEVDFIVRKDGLERVTRTTYEIIQL